MKRFLLLLSFMLFSTIVFSQYTRLTNIPTIYIETFNNEPITSKNDYIYANMVYVGDEGEVHYDSLEIRGRGNSTWGLAKKPYRIKFKQSTKFLGTGYAKNKSWTLLANHADKSLLRNAVTFAMGDFLGQPFTPAAHFVDLFLNGTYMGNYQVSDQINVDNKRVEIFEQEEVASDNDNITGGYLVEIDGFGASEEVYFTTGRNLIVSVKSPDEDVINNNQLNYIRNCLNDLESAMFSDNFQDAKLGYRSKVDSATLISWYIATELSANVDGFWSTYLYKDRDNPLIYFGPLWDYDIAYNNCNRVGDVTYRSMIDAGYGDDLTKVWMKRIVQDEWFNRSVNNVWKKKLSEGLEQYLYSYIDNMADYINASQQQNYSRYSIRSHVYNEIFLYSTYQEYIDQLKQFIGEHAGFLTTLFESRVKETGDSGNGNDKEETETLEPFVLNSDYYYRIYNRGANKVFDLSESDSSSVVIWTPSHDRLSQQWEIVESGEYYSLINRATGLALSDMSEPSTVGSNLRMADFNIDDPRQKWNFVTVNENGNYNIININSNNVVNNSGGLSVDGNPIVSYTNDDRNSISNNRQWRIVPEELIPDYIPDEVKDSLMNTVAEAEEFLSSLSDCQVGDGMFCYSREAVEALRLAVADAISFESTVPDDYILMNVNLSGTLRLARKKNLPDSNTLYVIRHDISDLYLNVTEERLSIKEREWNSSNQCFTFHQVGDGNNVFIKSSSGLYIRISSNGYWNMSGIDDVAGIEESASIDIDVMDGYYRMKTMHGAMGTDNLYNDSNVYSDKDENSTDDMLFARWIIEEYIEENPLAVKAAELDSVIAEARNSYITSWVGEYPLQTSLSAVNSLDSVIAEVERRVYSYVEDYDAAIETVNNAVAAVMNLNVPAEDKLYCLQNVCGLNLSCYNGLTVEYADTLDSSQHFSLIAVEGKSNVYNICCEGYYLSVLDAGKQNMTLGSTPRGELGEFIAEQTGERLFALKSAAGYLGVNEDNAGAQCHANADTFKDWSLYEVSPVNTGMNAAPSYAVDYAVCYDKNRKVISFVSCDMQALADVKAYIYTAGGRMLYCFAANEEQSVESLPSGTYIIKWSYDGKEKSIKFRK